MPEAHLARRAVLLVDDQPAASLSGRCIRQAHARDRARISVRIARGPDQHGGELRRVAVLACEGLMRKVAIPIGLCMAVAMLEGFDIQAMGVAAPRLAPEF